MTQIHRFTVGSLGSLFVALLLVPMAGAPPARADRDDRWEDWREAQEDRREDAREAREDWREDQRDRWEDWREEQEDRAENYAKARRRAERHYGGQRYEPLPPPAPYRQYRERVPVYRSYTPYSPRYRYYGTRRFGYYDYGHGGTVRVGPVVVHW